MTYTTKELTSEQAILFMGFYIPNINNSWRHETLDNGNCKVICLNITADQKAQIIKWEKGEIL